MFDIDIIVNDYYKKIYKISLFYLKNDEQDAEDAVQQIYIKIMEKLNTFEEKSKIYTWIYRIAVNTLKNIIRRKKLIQFISLEDISHQSITPSEMERDPAVQIESNESKDLKINHLEDAINQLSHRERTAFYLNFYEEIKQKKIAEIMGTSVSAVEALIHKSKKKIKKKIHKISIDV